METTKMHKKMVMRGSRSYRTYEEWKRKKIEELGATIESSYRTYEEWKRLCIENVE